MNNKDHFLLIIILIGLVLILKLSIMPISKSNMITNVNPYKDSIAKLDSQINFQMKRITNYEKTIDSLNSLPVKIKIKYRDQKASVPSATVAQLDSIIRTNAGLPQR